MEQFLKKPLNWKKGVLHILAASFFFTIATAIARHESQFVSIPTLLLFQSSVCLAFTLPWLILKGRESFRLVNWKVILLRSLAGYVSFACIFFAASRISLVNTVLLSNSAPFFIPLIIWLWRGIRIQNLLWLGICVGFLGIALVLKPGGSWDMTGTLVALGSALALAVSMIAQRRLIKKQPAYTILFYYFLFATLVSIPLSSATWKPLDFSHFSQLFLMGLLYAFGQWLFLLAFQYEKPSLLSPFNYVGVIYAFLIDWVIWKHLPGWINILGILVICLGAYLTMLAARQQGDQS